MQMQMTTSQAMALLLALMGHSSLLSNVVDGAERIADNYVAGLSSHIGTSRPQ